MWTQEECDKQQGDQSVPGSHRPLWHTELQQPESRDNDYSGVDGRNRTHDSLSLK